MSTPRKNQNNLLSAPGVKVAAPVVAAPGATATAAAPVVAAPAVTAAAPVVAAPGATAATQTAATEPKQPSCSDEKEDPLSKVFNYIYMFISIAAVVLVLIYFIMSTIDVFNFNIQTLMQYIKLSINPNMYNKDTVDFSTLLYHMNNTDTEPYTIFTQQELVIQMFNIGSIFVGLLLLQFVILAVIAIIHKIRGRPLSDMGSINFSKNIRPILLICVMVVAAFVLNGGSYTGYFLKKVQPAIIDTNTNVEIAKNYMYDNMTTNNSFLNSLVNGDLTNCVKIINQQTNSATIVRMLYTLSLYNFFKINISENEEEFNSVIQKCFTVAEIRVRSINPISYMYYNQNVFLPNVYPFIRQYIYGENKGISTLTKDKEVRITLTERINETNKKLMTIYKVPTRKSQVRNYIYINWIVAFIFAFIIYSITRQVMKDLMGEDILKAVSTFIQTRLGGLSVITSSINSGLNQVKHKTASLIESPLPTTTAPR